MKHTPSDFVTFLWRFFSSLKLTIFLLIGLAVVSVIGTLIPQGPPSQEYLRSLSRLTYHLYSTLGFFDMYHSRWFFFLLYLLTLNITACSLRRFPRDWRIITHPTTILNERGEGFFPNMRSWNALLSAQEQERLATEILERNFASPVVTRVDGEIHLFAQKGRFSRLGTYVLHFSIILIFLGAILGSLFGYTGFIRLDEGMSVSSVATSSGAVTDLGFTVRCDSFTPSFYPTGAPKEFQSVLSIVDNGEPVVVKRPVVVNHPLTYGGVTFYQSGYGRAEPSFFRFAVRDRKSGTVTPITSAGGDPVTLPGGDLLTVTEFSPDISAVFPGMTGSAVEVFVTGKGVESEPFVLLRDYPDISAGRGGAYVLTFEGADRKWRTVLKVAKDPGIRVVWAGCCFLLTGIFCVFFFSHRRIWVRIGEGRIVVAGSAGRNRQSFSPFFDEIVKKLESCS